MKQPNPTLFMGLTLFAILGGIGASYFQYSNIEAAEKDIAVLKKEDRDEGSLNTELNTITAQLNESQLKLDHLERSVSQAAYVPTLLTELENVGKQNGILVLGVRPVPKQATKPKKGEGEVSKNDRKPYTELDIEVRGRGNYRSVLNFVNALQTFPKIVAARTIALTPKADKFGDNTSVSLEVTVELRTYLFIPPKVQAPKAGTKSAVLITGKDGNNG